MAKRTVLYPQTIEGAPIETHNLPPVLSNLQLAFKEGNENIAAAVYADNAHMTTIPNISSRQDLVRGEDSSEDPVLSYYGRLVTNSKGPRPSIEFLRVSSTIPKINPETKAVICSHAARAVISNTSLGSRRVVDMHIMECDGKIQFHSICPH